MRISDWSADVCSSDLRALVGAGFHEDFQLRVGEHDRAHVTAIANQARRLSKIPLLLQQRRTYRRLGGDQRRQRTGRFLANVMRPVLAIEDRKSTRLNSSH